MGRAIFGIGAVMIDVIAATVLWKWFRRVILKRWTKRSDSEELHWISRVAEVLLLLLLILMRRKEKTICHNS